jgi:hypothetical protein
VRIPASAQLTLSAASSYDPDLSLKAGSVSSAARDSLGFEWSCSVFDGAIKNTCLNVSGGTLLLPHDPVLILPAGALGASEWPYLFTVTVQKPGRAPASAVMPVEVVDGPALIVSIESVCWRHAREQSPCCVASDGAMIANSDSRFFMTATVIGGSNVSFLWAISPSMLSNSSEDSVAPVGYRRAIFVLVGSDSMLISGNQYNVTLTAEDQAGALGIGLQQLWINSPPMGGVFSACLLSESTANGACARVGQAVVDTFRLECQMWVDPDGDPTLAYRFGYLMVGAAGDAAVAAAADSAANNVVAAATANNTVWFDWGADSKRDMSLPGGELVLFSQVSNFWIVASLYQLNLNNSIHA